MPYRYLEDIAIADAAFEAWGETLEAMIIAAGDATLNVMIGDLTQIRPRQYRHLRVEDDQLDLLLFQLLQELIYYKDAEQLLLRIQNIRLEQKQNQWIAFAELAGEPIDPQRHDLVVDIKAVTFYGLGVQKKPNGWFATVTVDV